MEEGLREGAGERLSGSCGNVGRVGKTGMAAALSSFLGDGGGGERAERMVVGAAGGLFLGSTRF